MFEKHTLVTVIITIHNAEKYLEECLTSVQNQTWKNIEILCIDGGSTDRSPEILKTYQKADSRIYIINDPNTSYGHKVNVGIEKAHGKYIAVLESDDMFEFYMLEELLKIAHKYHTDIVNADFQYFFDVEQKRFFIAHQMFHKQPYNCLIENKKRPENFEISERYWTGLFSKEFLIREKIKLNETPGASFQDMSFRFLTSVLAERIYHLNKPVYCYRMDNTDSSMKDATKTVVIADEHKFLKNELIKRNIDNIFIWKLAYYYKYVDFYGNLCRLKGKERSLLFERYKEEIQKDIYNIPDYSVDDYPHTEKEIWEQPESFLVKIEGVYQKNQEQNRALYRFFERISKADRLILFGCGLRGERAYKFIYSMRRQILCYTDNSKVLWGTLLNGISVVSPDEAAKKYPDALWIIANRYHQEEIRKQIVEMGIKTENIQVFY